MKHFRFIGVALLVVFALGVVAASVAQAETAPWFAIGGTRLIAGKTHNFDARGLGPIEVGGGGVTITCQHESTEQGVLLGSNAGNPGKDNEVVVFSECALVVGNGFPNCNLATTTLTTNALNSEQVENVEGTHVGKRLLEEISPADPAVGFITLNFTGTNCTISEAILSGEAVGETLLDNSGRGTVELGQTPQERTSWIVKFPATPITEVWLISNGVGKAVKTKEVAFGGPAVQTGEVLVLLASTKYVPEPNAFWSPLP